MENELNGVMSPAEEASSDDRERALELVKYAGDKHGIKQAAVEEMIRTARVEGKVFSCVIEGKTVEATMGQGGFAIDGRMANSFWIDKYTDVIEALMNLMRHSKAGLPNVRVVDPSR